MYVHLCVYVYMYIKRAWSAKWVAKDWEVAHGFVPTATSLPRVEEGPWGRFNGPLPCGG